MRITLTIIGLFAIPACAFAQRQAASYSDPAIESIKLVADWQLRQSSWNSDNNWLHGTLYAGMMAAYETTKDTAYLNATRTWAQKFDWELYNGSNFRHADYHACAQAYLELYFLDLADPSRIADAKAVSDTIAASPAAFNCNNSNYNYWWWCDALFMEPPTLARLSRATGDPKYLTLMHNMWSDTQGCLYDTGWQLFYRDHTFFTTKSPNGLPLFWSRGNGWVMGGIVRVLQYLPATDPHRNGYIQLFQAMAARIKDLQLSDGYWHGNLLDPYHYPTPETSGTGFYCYALAWGVNQGYLPEGQYWPAVEKAWRALRMAVHASGKLGWVQPVGSNPAPTTEGDTQVFGVGAYLLAGSEIEKYRLAHDPGLIESFEAFGDTAALAAQWQPNDAAHTAAALADYGNRFMTMNYDVAGPSGIRATFPAAQDWPPDRDWITFAVRGSSANAPASLYARLTNGASQFESAVPASGTVAANTWTEMDYRLSSFSGLDRASIGSLALGALRPTPSATGTGVLQIDTIRRTGIPAGAQGEEGLLDGNAPPNVATTRMGYHGTGYATFPTANLTLHWTNIPGKAGSGARLRLRYANGSGSTANATLTVNGVSQAMNFPATANWTDWQWIEPAAPYSFSEATTIDLAVVNANRLDLDELRPVFVGSDIIPPAVPVGVVSNSLPGGLDLHWTPNAESDIAGYYIYASTTSDGIGARVSESPQAAANLLIDWLFGSTTYYLRISAVDTSGNESAPGAPLAFTAPIRQNAADEWRRY